MTRNSINHLRCKYKAWLLVEHSAVSHIKWKEGPTFTSGRRGGQPSASAPGPAKDVLSWLCVPSRLAGLVLLGWRWGNSPYQVPPPPPQLPRMNHEDTSRHVSNWTCFGTACLQQCLWSVKANIVNHCLLTCLMSGHVWIMRTPYSSPPTRHTHIATQCAKSLSKHRRVLQTLAFNTLIHIN